MTRRRGFTGDFGNRGRWLPPIVLDKRDLIHKDLVRVDKWASGREDWVTLGTCPMTGASQLDSCPWSAARCVSVTGKP